MDEDRDGGPKFKLKKTLIGHEAGVLSIKFSGPSTGGKYLASTSIDKSIKIWTTENWDYKKTLHGHSKGINDVAWSECGKYIATASDDFTLRLWEIGTWKCLRCFEGHTNYVFCCAFNPQGNMLVSGSYDETLKVWNVRDGRCMRSIPAHSDPLTSVEFSHDGTMMISSSFDGLVRLWDTATGRCLKTIIDEPNPPVGIARFTPNSRYIVIGAMAHKVELWDYEAQKKLKVYKGHKNESHGVFLSFISTWQRPLIVVGSEDGAVVIYDVNSQQMIQRLEGRPNKEAEGDGHFEPALAVSAHPTSPFIASASLDGSIKIWETTGNI